MDMAKNNCKENGHLVESYYHCVDERYPLVTLTLPELFERQANFNLDSGITWYRPFERITYSQLYKRGMEIAKGLIAIGMKRGDTILSIGVEGSDSLVLFVAASALGIKFAAPYIYSPVKNNVETFINKLRPNLMLLGNTVTGADLEDPYFTVLRTLDDMAAFDSSFVLPKVYRDKLTTMGKVDCNTPNYKHSQLDIVEMFATLVENGAIITNDELERRKSMVTANEPCFYTFSSGSTGDSKTILIGAAMLTNSGSRRQERWEMTKNQRIATSCLCTEDFALIDEVCCGAYVGNEVLALPQADTWDVKTVCSEMLDALSTHRIDIVYCDQYFLANMVNHPELTEGYDISNLKCAMLSGSGTSATFKEQLLKLFPDSVDCYGLSEFYYGTCIAPGEMRKKMNSVGKIMVNQEIKVVDHNGNCVPRNTKGELWMRGCNTFLKYEGQPELTKSMITSDGWLKTGDCGVMNEDGDLQIVGRLSTAERFKVNGDVVYSQPIEKLMKTSKLVKEIVVIGRSTGTTYGHELSYCIQLFEKDSMTIEEAYEFAVHKVESSAEWPIRIFFYENFPLQGNRNKISRKALTKDVLEMVANDFKINMCDPTYDI